MVTIIVNKEKLIFAPKPSGRQYVEVYCLSADEKPPDVPNATPALEMDTGDVFLFDEATQTWLAQKWE